MKNFRNINKFNHFLGFGDSKHPLIDIRTYSNACANNFDSIKFGFYKIGIKKNFKGFIEYGKTIYDSEKGIMYFIEPGQVLSWSSSEPWDGAHIFIDPDIFKSYPSFARIIKKCSFFSYETNEALFLTGEEEKIVNFLIKEAQNELNNKKDEFSINNLLSYITTLLNIIERFYTRQFNTRRTIYNKLTKDFIHLLKTYYDETIYSERQPSVYFFAEKLNVTPKYLSDIIKNNTSKTALYLIHEHVLEEAKILLTTSDKTVSEISYILGFEYPSYFSRLFKNKNKISPSKYRKTAKINNLIINNS